MTLGRVHIASSGMVGMDDVMIIKFWIGVTRDVVVYYTIQASS
jgi:hypothetical protein